MSTTTDPNAPCLGHGSDDKPVPQNQCYLVLSEEERAKGFVRPVRDTYRHVGIAGPQFPTRPLTADEERIFNTDNHERYVRFEEYPAGFKLSTTGRFWTQKQLDQVGKGCGAVTTMARAIAETYARDPGFYGSTYCIGCHMHRPVGRDGEFVWVWTQGAAEERVGT